MLEKCKQYQVIIFWYIFLWFDPILVEWLMEYQLKGGAVLFYAASLLIFIFAVSIFTYDMYTESYIKCLTEILFLSKIKDHKPFLYIIFRIISNILHLENIICDVLILKDIATIKKIENLLIPWIRGKEVILSSRRWR